jgi:hypothetical protein
MERQVPAMRELVSTVPLVATQKQKAEEKKERSFMQNVREFLGFAP